MRSDVTGKIIGPSHNVDLRVNKATGVDADTRALLSTEGQESQ